MVSRCKPSSLRFLEDGTFTRVGGNDELSVDVRLIAATNRDIIEAIRQNNFREDAFLSFERSSITPASVARTRGNDVMLLARKFPPAF